jgi:7-cyano-7-deazaguanine synthase
MADRQRTICLLSGGLDSSTLLFHLLHEGRDVIGLSIDYGQRHARELASAEEIAAAAGIPLKHVDLSSALRPVFVHATSSQLNEAVPVPHGHYAAETMKLTIVPNRNMLLIAVAGALAEALRGQTDEEIEIAYAAHAGDHAIYPDCRPEFFGAMDAALRLGTEHVSLIAPFGHWTKTEIARRAADLDVPIELTYSCYEGDVEHCGACGTCVERQEAFREAGVVDPTAYKVASGPH